MTPSEQERIESVWRQASNGDEHISLSALRHAFAKLDVGTIHDDGNASDASFEDLCAAYVRSSLSLYISKQPLRRHRFVNEALLACDERSQQSPRPISRSTMRFCRAGLLSG